MKTIGITEFKQRCFALLDRMGPDGLVITKHGRPVARVVPLASESSSLISRLADRIEITGDIESTGIRWDAES